MDFFFEEQADWPGPNEAVFTFFMESSVGTPATKFFHARFYSRSELQPFMTSFQKALNRNSLDGVYVTPISSKALVLAGGAAYLFDVSARTAALLPAFPIQSVLTRPNLNLLLAMDFPTVTAITPYGYARSPNLVDDELEVSPTQDGQFSFTGFDKSTGEERRGRFAIEETSTTFKFIHFDRF